jgi:hypothetical protein
MPRPTVIKFPENLYDSDNSTLSGEVLAGVAAKSGTTRLFDNEQLLD